MGKKQEVNRRVEVDKWNGDYHISNGGSGVGKLRHSPLKLSISFGEGPSYNPAFSK